MQFKDASCLRYPPRWPELESLLVTLGMAFDVPAVLLAIDDERTIVATASPELTCDELVGDHAFCRLALTSGGDVVVEDVALDARLDGRTLGPGGPPVRFYAAVPVIPATGQPAAALVLVDTVPRQLSPDQLRRLPELAGAIAVLLVDRRRAVHVGNLADALAAQIERTRREQLAMERYRKMYERTSAVGHIGVWECDLATEALTWTNGVYDIFELPRGSPVSRDVILALYDRPSRLRMERMRRKAIEDCSSCSLDIRVRTVSGLRRWVRLTIEVEAENGRAVRIFGLKQDITQEKDLLERLRRLAEIDPLTGLANRSMFDGKLARALASDGRAARPSALALIDLDGFKALNDSFGHAAGDECLRQIGRRLRTVFRRPHEIGRMGGDEFAVLMRGQQSEAEVTDLVRTAIAEVRRPIAFGGNEFVVGASVGVTRPADMRAHDLNTLFAEADRAMYAAKRAGRNTFRFHSRPEGAAAPPCVAAKRNVTSSRRLTAGAGASTPAR
jgi:diguanylate cyclase (GGDEF)-like protein